MGRVVVVLLELEPRVLDRLDPDVETVLLAGPLTISASSITENCSVNWLKTRNSPRSAGFSTASSTHWRVSTMFRYPRVCPPLP